MQIRLMEGLRRRQSSAGGGGAYAAVRTSGEDDEEAETNLVNRTGPGDVMDELHQIAMYDVGFCLYFFAFIFF